VERPELLRLEGVSAGYRKVTVLYGIDLSLRAGDTFAVVGANGAGKSTLLRAIMGQIPVTAGGISFAGRSLLSLSTHHRARLGIGYAPEGRQLFPAMSVEENLELGAARERPDERRRRIERMLGTFPKLAPLRRTRCGYLSGGEQQMVAIARALMAGPRLLLLDEPSTGLAPKVIAELYASLGALRDTGLAVLVVEQNARAALRFAQHGAVFEDGRLTLRGPARELAADPRVVSAYVGALAGHGWAGADVR
jgi:branched-chain amino acid transport system ATP-binding protein